MIRQELNPVTCKLDGKQFNSSNWILQVHRVDQTLLPAQVDSFVGCSFHCALHPPALFKKWEDRKKKKREVLHLFRCYTHTHISSTYSCCLTHRSSTTSFVFPSFPVPLQLLFLIIGRSWLAGLAGPLISVFWLVISAHLWQTVEHEKCLKPPTNCL